MGSVCVKPKDDQPEDKHKQNAKQRKDRINHFEQAVAKIDETVTRSIDEKDLKYLN